MKRSVQSLGQKRSALLQGTWETALLTPGQALRPPLEKAHEGGPQAGPVCDH